jgi:hypothetical protein
LVARRGSGDSFFRFVQKQLRNECKGRLLALILRELARHEPLAFLRFLRDIKLAPEHLQAIRNGTAQIETEWCYTSGRRADLAVLVDGKEALLFEVKEDDLASPGNSEQLNDYLSFITDHPGQIHFVHLSRYSPVGALSSLQVKARVHDLRYRHLYDAVSEFGRTSTDKAPLSRMVREYLEDIGVDSYKKISLDQEGDALTLLVTQMSGFDHFHGLGRLHSASNATLAPDLLRRLLGNAVVLGEWLFEANSKVMRQRPKHRFIVQNRCSPRQLKSAISSPDPDDGLVDVPRKAVQEGILSVYASAALEKANSQPWAYLEIGQYVRVSAAEREKAQIALYAQLLWKGDGLAYEESDDWFTNFPSEGEATSELSRLIRLVLAKARKIDGYPTVFDKISVPMPRS